VCISAGFAAEKFFAEKLRELARIIAKIEKQEYTPALTCPPLRR
jgi:hypothetical protein